MGISFEKPWNCSPFFISLPHDIKFFDALSIKSAHLPNCKVFNASIAKPKNNFEHLENKYNKYITKILSKFCSRESR